MYLDPLHTWMQLSTFWQMLHCLPLTDVNITVTWTISCITYGSSLFICWHVIMEIKPRTLRIQQSEITWTVTFVYFVTFFQLQTKWINENQHDNCEWVKKELLQPVSRCRAPTHLEGPENSWRNSLNSWVLTRNLLYMKQRHLYHYNTLTEKAE
jgi:hypothetical protein